MTRTANNAGVYLSAPAEQPAHRAQAAAEDERESQSSQRLIIRVDAPRVSDQALGPAPIAGLNPGQGQVVQRGEAVGVEAEGSAFGVDASRAVAQFEGAHREAVPRIRRVWFALDDGGRDIGRVARQTCIEQQVGEFRDVGCLKDFGEPFVREEFGP